MVNVSHTSKTSHLELPRSIGLPISAFDMGWAANSISTMPRLKTVLSAIFVSRLGNSHADNIMATITLYARWCSLRH